MTAEVTKPAYDTNPRLERLSEWLGTELRRYASHEATTAVVKLCFAAGAAVLVSMLILYFFGRIFLVATHSFVLALAIPGAILLVALVAQGFRHRREHAFMQVHGHKIHFADHKTHFGNPNEGTSIHSILLFPGWLFFSAFESLSNAWSLRHADPEFCARVLAYLASEDRRIFIPDLEHKFSPKITANLKALIVVPGVLISSRETPGLFLNEELGARIRDLL